MGLKTDEIDAVLRLPAAKRYDHFIKRVADWGDAWGLWSDGWALAASDTGDRVFPLWPAIEYAERCAVGEWAGFSPERIEVHSLLDELLPKLQRDGIAPAVFYTPSDRGIIADVFQLSTDLRTELDKVE